MYLRLVRLPIGLRSTPKIWLRDTEKIAGEYYCNYNFINTLRVSNMPFMSPAARGPYVR
jgi:hypothetical protein